MIVTFCGHSEVAHWEEVRGWLHRTVEKLIGMGADMFLLGGYGEMDDECPLAGRESINTPPEIPTSSAVPAVSHRVP